MLDARAKRHTVADMHRWLIPVVVLSLAACETRQPITRGQAASIGDNVQRQYGLAWGDPEEVLPPAPGADGHRWWQLRYADGHFILVDADSGWGRLPAEGYRPRMRAVAAHTTSASVVEEGSLVLRLSEPVARDPDGEGELEREAARLNVLAAQTGLHPLFSLRKDREGRSSLLWGWQGDRGVARDEHAVEWVRLRTTYSGPEWVDLLP